MSLLRYATKSGISVTRSSSRLPFRRGLNHLLSELDRHRGVYLSSGYEYPDAIPAGTWRRCALRLESSVGGGAWSSVPQRPRSGPGAALHSAHWPPALGFVGVRGPDLAGRLKPLPAFFPEEERSKQPSAFSILRALVQEFGDQDSASSWLGPSATTCCSSSTRSGCACRAAGRRICTSFSATTSTSWIARREVDRTLPV